MGKVIVLPLQQNMPEEPDFVEAPLRYLVNTGAKPVTYVPAVGSGVSRHTGQYEERTVTIYNGRRISNPFSLEREGFLLVSHKTKVSDFQNQDEVRSVYYPEIKRLVKEIAGASSVLVFDHTLRAAGDVMQKERKVREPVQNVHNDYTECSGPQRVRDVLPENEADTLLGSRFAIIQVWRPISEPVRREPLAIADAQSIAAKDLIAAERRYPDRIGETYQLAFNPDHRWFYFPNMQSNEALVFKTYDSERDGRARFAAHASFDDPTSPPDAPARESIEVRTLAFFFTPETAETRLA